MNDCQLIEELKKAKDKKKHEDKVNMRLTSLRLRYIKRIIEAQELGIICPPKRTWLRKLKCPKCGNKLKLSYTIVKNSIYLEVKYQLFHCKGCDYRCADSKIKVRLM